MLILTLNPVTPLVSEVPTYPPPRNLSEFVAIPKPHRRQFLKLAGTFDWKETPLSDWEADAVRILREAEYRR